MNEKNRIEIFIKAELKNFDLELMKNQMGGKESIF